MALAGECHGRSLVPLVKTRELRDDLLWPQSSNLFKLSHDRIDGCSGDERAPGRWVLHAFQILRVSQCLRFQLPGEREFAVVSASEDSTITLQRCLECDHISKYRWNKSKKRFVLLPPDPDE